jgi:hypothetical protein
VSEVQRFRPQLAGPVTLAAVPVLIVGGAAAGAIGTPDPGGIVLIGVVLALAMVVLGIVVLVVIGVRLRSRAARVRARRPGAVVFPSMRTLSTSQLLGDLGVTRAPAYCTVALTSDGVELWWDDAVRAFVPWRQIKEIRATDAPTTFSGWAGSSPALSFSVIWAGEGRSLALPVIDPARPYLWSATAGNRALDAALALKAQAPG